MDVHDVAKVCHEANKALCEGLGDFSQEPWEKAKDWQRESSVASVRYFIGCPNAPDSDQHDAWSRDKTNDGWVFGKVKDDVKKTHPCLVPFNELPLGQQAKDVLFKAVCRTLVPLTE